MRKLWVKADPVNSYLRLTYERGGSRLTLAGLEPGGPPADPGVLR